MTQAEARDLHRAIWLWCVPLPLLIHLGAYQLDTGGEFFARWIESESGLIENATALVLIPATIFALVLSFRAGGYRGKAGISVLFGDPVNWELAERVRVHQNFLEYVPLMLILMAAIELNHGSGLFLHVTGFLLLIARVAHAIGLKHDNMAHIGRLIGAAGTSPWSTVRRYSEL